MNIFSSIKRSVRKSVALSAVAVVLAAAGIAATTTTVFAAGGFDCDANAVEYCGAAASSTSSTASASNIINKYNRGDGKNSAKSIQTIFGYAGISSADVQALGSTARLGTVTKTGNVMIGNKVVATGAKSIGRENITDGAGSTKVVLNGVTFYVRSTDVAFNSSSISAYVVMKNGVYDYAVLLSCGNPVIAKAVTPTPPPTPKTPAYTIQKEVRAVGTASYSKSITLAQPGTTVEYRITVKSTGTAAAQNVKAYDTLPAHIAYTDGTAALNGNALTAAQAAGFFNASTGYTIGSLAPGASDVFTFKAVVGPADTTANCVAETLNNVGKITATSLPEETSTATVAKNCAPKPAYACTSLTSVKVSRTDYTFTAVATATNGATITGYTFGFGDGATKVVTTAGTTASTSHSYTAPGTYNATVSVQVKVGTTVTTVTAPACNTTVTVAQAPAAECTNLTLVQGTNPRAVSATATYVVSNGATLTGSSFNWGDSTTSAGVAGTGNTLTAAHTYASDGTKTVVATLTFSSTNGTVAPSTCQAVLTIATVPPTCDKLDVTINNDDKTVTVKNLKTTANGSTYELASITWGDSTQPILSTDLAGQSHTYTTNGPFTIRASAFFALNTSNLDNLVEVTGPGCVATVTFTETPTPPVVTPPATPATPAATPVARVTVLPKTGAGSTIAIFGSVAAAAAVAYNFVQRRRFNI